MSYSRPYALVQITKQAYWRGAAKTFQNSYWISGNPSASDFESVIDALQQIENKVFPRVNSGLGVGFVSAAGYSPGTGPAAVEVPYNPSLAAGSATGFLGPTGGYDFLTFATTLESCLETRMPLEGVSSRGKPVYCRKYFRGIYAGSADDVTNEPIGAADLSVIASTILPWKTGMGTNDYVVIGASGRQASAAPTAQPYIGNHQVPRGKKKKATSSSILGVLTDLSHLSSIAGAAEDLVSDL